jgi:hypothetical protein
MALILNRVADLSGCDGPVNWDIDAADYGIGTTIENNKYDIGDLRSEAIGKPYSLETCCENYLGKIRTAQRGSYFCMIGRPIKWSWETTSVVQIGLSN